MSNISPSFALKTLDVVGVGVKALGSFSSQKGKKNAAQLDASTAELEAADARSRAGKIAAQHISKGRRGAAGARSQVAGRGFAVGVGTAADVAGAHDYMARLDAATARENGRKEEAAANMRRANATATAKTAQPTLTAVGTLLGAASQVAERWDVFKTKPAEPAPKKSS